MLPDPDIEDELYNNLSYDWDAIEKEDADFYLFKYPESFAFGASTSAHQVEGGNCNNQWWAWEEATLGKECSSLSGEAAGHWDFPTFQADVDRAQFLGLNSYRMSIEWSRLQPSPGETDYAAIEQYRDMIQYIRESGMKPSVTLYHATLPLWFYHMDHFLKTENIGYFSEFCYMVAEHFGDLIEYYATSNGVNDQAILMFILGNIPNRGVSLFKFIKYSKNVLDAHVSCYKSIKKSKYGLRSKVGFVLNVTFFDPPDSYNFMNRPLYGFLNKVSRGIYYHFFKSGEWQLLMWKHVNKEAPKTLDWWGVNYYYHLNLDLSRCILNLDIFYDVTKCNSIRTGEVPTDYHGFAVYAEGLYRALVEARGLNIPIWVTETGAADADDAVRTIWIKRYLYTLKIYFKEYGNYPKLLGFNYFTLVDSYAWNLGYNIRYGLYHVDFDSQERTIKKSALLYKNAIKFNYKNEDFIDNEDQVKIDYNIVIDDNKNH